MGLIRKTASISTLGGVKYTSRREAQTKQALAETKLLRTQERLAREEAKTARRAAEDSGAPAPAADTADVAWYRQPTLGGALRKAAQRGTDTP